MGTTTGATKNGSSTRTGTKPISIQPATTPIILPIIPTSQTTGGITTPTSFTPTVNGATAPVVQPTGGGPLAGISSQTSYTPTVNGATAPIVRVTLPAVVSAPTTANIPLPTKTTTAPTVMKPIVTLTGKDAPPILPPVVFKSRPSPIKILTSKDMVEETLSLDTHTFFNGEPILNISALRPDIISQIDFKQMYEQGEVTEFGTYIDHLYQSSLVRDTLRKYILLNKTIAEPRFQTVLNNIATTVNRDIATANTTMQTLDGLIQKINQINNVLDLKNNMSYDYAIETPYVGLRSFVTQRMLFSERSYNIFSDTKILYQLLFDLGGILEKCSFNLLSNFVDAARSAYINSPTTIRQNTVQDSITIDLTYGDNLAFTSEAVRSKYVFDYVTFNGILNVLPPLSTDRFKFMVNFLSKEFKVSKGLGKFNFPEASFFGFRNQGNPFDNIIGGIPSDIFVAPLGNNSLATLFYLNTSTQNAVVLPFESRQVAGDGETVFVPGTNYFTDGILRGDLSAYNSYRETFSSRLTNAKNVFDKLLLNQSAYDSTSTSLESTSLLKTAYSYYISSQDSIRGTNNDSTNLLSFLLFSLGNSSARVKFEVYKLLLLVALYDTRPAVTTNTAQTDKFRDLLLNELSSKKIQGFSEALTEDNLPKFLENQISVVRKLVLENVAPKATLANKTATGLSNNKGAQNTKNNEKKQLGLPIPTSTDKNINPESNVATVQIEQLTQMIYALRTTNNLFKNVLDMCKEMFASASSNEQAYHLIQGSSVTRYHGLTLSGFILFVFEVFSCLVDQYAAKNVSYALVGNQSNNLITAKYVEVNFSSTNLTQISVNIRNFLRGSGYEDAILLDYQTKLSQENDIIQNILRFFTRLNDRFTNAVQLSREETAALNQINTINANTLSSTRTAKSILQGIVNKKSLYSKNGNLDFYLPSSKAVSSRNWGAVRKTLAMPEFLSKDDLKLFTVGIPYGFVKSALDARLSKNEVYNGKLEQTTTDLINISVHKLDKNDNGIIFKPIQFKFDLSLFAKGFDDYTLDQIRSYTYPVLANNFQFYDFDESVPYNQVTAKTRSYIVNQDPYYSASPDRQALGTEVCTNLFRSFIFDMYLHMLTGLNASEETFIAYTEAETTAFTSEMAKIPAGTADLTKIKFMAPEYRDLLVAFQNQRDDQKLMLSICNDIPKTVFRKKMFDRTFNILVNVNDFPIDVNAMNQTPEGVIVLQQLRRAGRLQTLHGETYKTPDDLVLDSYFINVELVQ
jgi:hypothetical protein